MELPDKQHLIEHTIKFLDEYIPIVQQLNSMFVRYMDSLEELRYTMKRLEREIRNGSHPKDYQTH
ncbi:MAG: hypothetical protein QXT45_07500 [Candidatus Bilamarchaeaceae archaeon]